MPFNRPGDPSLAVIRIPNLSGALVLVTATEHGSHTSYAWSCTGCLLDVRGGHLNNLRDSANDHAGWCRALPQPERPKPATA